MNFSYLEDFMKRLTSWRTPGNAVSVCLDGKEVFSCSSGYADKENNIAMTPDHLIYIYSCSKVATVTAALQLYERGFFLLDDPLYQFIPEYKEMYIKDKDGTLTKAKNPITMRHLFTMTSGLTYNTTTDAFKKAREITNGKMETLEVIKCLAKDPLSFEPGTAWQYSLSHDVLAATVEVISGKRFSDYMRENIFAPLGMDNSFYHIDEKAKESMAQQYTFKNSDETDLVKLQSSASYNFPEGEVVVTGKENCFIFGEGFDSGGAGIITTVSDYSRFCCALANGGKGSTGESILSSGTIELLRTNQLTPETTNNFDWVQVNGYGYGLGVRTMINRARSGSNGSVGEFGWGGAAGSTVLVDPDKKLSVFYAQHMLNPQEHYYQPRLRNIVYNCLDK